MAKYLVTATKPTQVEARVEADSLVDARTKANELKPEDFTEVSSHTNVFVDGIYLLGSEDSPYRFAGDEEC